MKRLPALLLLTAATLYPQAPPQLLGVTKWRMNFTVTSKTSGTESGLGGTRIWNFTSTATGSVLLSRVEDLEDLSWEGIADVRVSLSYTSKWELPGGNCTQETNTTYSGAPDDPKEYPAWLGMNRDDGFEFDLGPRQITYPIQTTWTCKTGQSEVYNKMETFTWSPLFDEFPYPASGTQLGGMQKKWGQNISGELPSINDAEFTITFTIVPDGAEELSVEIDDSDAYKKWRPDAQRNGGPGTPLRMTARLVSSTGKTPNARVSSVKWELKNTSKEPGIALNWPFEADDDEFDLKLEKSASPSTVFDEKLQWLERFEVSGYEDSATILPYDWGGWADLEVTFALNDGRTIKGKLKPGGDSLVRIPRRTPDSKIADIWKQTLASQGKRVGADDADTEGTPEGDGTPGDGLTVYEEYRGFYENGVHIEGDPATKDLFVLDKSGGIGAGGISRFQRITKLAVHGKLQPLELPVDRVINKNRSAGPHLVDQHGLTVRVDNSLKGRAEARGGPGNPKKVREVAIPAEFRTWTADYLASTLAHELLHAVNVYHHGDQDRRFVTWVRGGDGLLREFAPALPAEGVEIRVRLEDGADVTDLVNSGVKIWMGSKNGQHSGTENCVMRYDCSQTYIADSDPKLRYLVEEPVGTGLCTTPNGTGVNVPGRRPQPRYVEASATRGSCAKQVLVNDAVEPPRR
jgi:hypothetical protein